MGLLTRILSFVLLLLVIPLTSALKFEIHAVQAHDAVRYERCIRNFVAKEQLVVVTAVVSGKRGDGRMFNMHIRDAMGNDYHKAKDVYGKNRFAFTSHAGSAFDVCFENSLSGSHGSMNSSRHIELDIDIGTGAKDSELRRSRGMVGKMDCLRGREQKLRDTNESVNKRVAFAIVVMLVGFALGFAFPTVDMGLVLRWLGW